MFPVSKNVFWNLTDIQAEHSYSLSEDSAPQSPALSIKMDQESGRSSCPFNGFTRFYIHLFFAIWLCTSRKKKYGQAKRCYWCLAWFFATLAVYLAQFSVLYNIFIQPHPVCCLSVRRLNPLSFIICDIIDPFSSGQKSSSHLSEWLLASSNMDALQMFLISLFENEGLCHVNSCWQDLRWIIDRCRNKKKMHFIRNLMFFYYWKSISSQYQKYSLFLLPSVCNHLDFWAV